MYPKVKQIIVTWRLGRTHGRIPIGIIKSNILNGTTFEYIPDGVKKVKEKGFTCYSDFPDLNKKYNANVLNIFSQRINNSDRTDIQKYYDFWEVPSVYKKDIFYLLAYTQGLLPTDNFEFLAEFYSIKNLKFVSEITGLSEYSLETGTLHEGEVLTWKPEPQNKYDSKAVALYKDEKIIGHVKKIHSHVFYLEGANSLQVSVKKLEQNGHINRAYILISQKQYR
jgi:hypothetical protein